MSVFGDELPQSSTKPPSPGEDLYGLSIEELSTRITLYQTEIVRLEAERVKKTAETAAAHAIFGNNS